MRRHGLNFALSVLVATGLGAPCAIAAPLDADACARLKLQKDALVTAGARNDLGKSSQEPPAQMAPERLQRIRTLMDVEGQLRFRCMMELPIATLKPEPVEDPADTSDAPAAGKAAAPKDAVPKRKKAAAQKAEPAASATADNAAGTPATKAAKSAASEPAPTKTTPSKPRAKADDAYRAPASGDANGTPLDKQAPSSN